MFSYLLLMASNRALNITRLSCFGIVILTPIVVMKMMTRKELSAAWELDTTEPLIMFTEQLSTLGTSRGLRSSSTTHRVADFSSVITGFRSSCFTCFPFSSFTCLSFFPDPLFFSSSFFFLHCLFFYFPFFQGFSSRE